MLFSLFVCFLYIQYFLPPRVKSHGFSSFIQGVNHPLPIFMQQSLEKTVLTFETTPKGRRFCQYLVNIDSISVEKLAFCKDQSWWGNKKGIFRYFMHCCSLASYNPVFLLITAFCFNLITFIPYFELRVLLYSWYTEQDGCDRCSYNGHLLGLNSLAGSLYEFTSPRNV